MCKQRKIITKKIKKNPAGEIPLALLSITGLVEACSGPRESKKQRSRYGRTRIMLLDISLHMYLIYFSFSFFLVSVFLSFSRRLAFPAAVVCGTEHANAVRGACPPCSVLVVVSNGWCTYMCSSGVKEKKEKTEKKGKKRKKGEAARYDTTPPSKGVRRREPSRLELQALRCGPSSQPVNRDGRPIPSCHRSLIAERALPA